MRLMVTTLLLMSAMSGPLAGQQTPGKQTFFAFFARIHEQSFPLSAVILQTRLNFSNPGPGNSQISIHVISRDGTNVPVDLLDEAKRTVVPNPFQLNGRSSIIVAVIPRAPSPLVLGWVRIDSSEPIAGLEHIERDQIADIGPISARNTLASVALPPSTPVREFSLSLVDDTDWFSGISIAVADTSGVARKGVLTLLDGAGQTVASRPVSVSFTTQIIKLGTELFPQLETIKEGTILGQFDGDVIVTSLRFNRRTDVFTLNLVSGKTM